MGGSPGETIGYPAQPRLIRPSFRESVFHITLIILQKIAWATNLVKYSLKIVN